MKCCWHPKGHHGKKWCYGITYDHDRKVWLPCKCKEYKPA